MVWCELGDECFELVSTLYRRGADQAADSICSCLEIECLRLVYCSVRVISDMLVLPAQSVNNVITLRRGNQTTS